jgi:acetyltransferase-like isoleucine patch superfamily enzyme
VAGLSRSNGMTIDERAYTRYPGVSFDEGSATVGEFVIIGVPPRGQAQGALATRIGARAVLRSHTVVYAGNVIGDDFQTGHGVLIREFNQIGNRVSVGSHSIIEHHVIIEDGVRIHSQAFVPEFTVLEAGSSLGPGTVLTNTRYPWSPEAKETMRGPHVETAAIIGANVTVLPGVRIGAGALIGAGAVVVKDVPPGVVVVGNPARVVRAMADVAAYRRAAACDQEAS